MTTTKAIQQLIERAGITLTAKQTARNPHMDESRDMDHWRCVLRRGKKTMVVYFSKGYGYKGAAPKVDEVLDCLASDAAGFENAQSFEDWCSEYGYDTDSRKAERAYKAVERQASRLAKVLSVEDYDALLWHTERL